MREAVVVRAEIIAGFFALEKVRTSAVGLVVVPYQLQAVQQWTLAMTATEESVAMGSSARVPRVTDKVAPAMAEARMGQLGLAAGEGRMARTVLGMRAGATRQSL